MINYDDPVAVSGKRKRRPPTGGQCSATRTYGRLKGGLCGLPENHHKHSPSALARQREYRALAAAENRPMTHWEAMMDDYYHEFQAAVSLT